MSSAVSFSPLSAARVLNSSSVGGVWDCDGGMVSSAAEYALVAAEHLLHLAEEAFGFGAGLAAGLLEFLEQLLLLGGEIGRRLDADLDVHVAMLRRTDDRHALAAQPELMAGLGPRRNVDARHLAVERRHLDRAAERRLHHGDRHAAVDVGALALEQLVPAHRQEDVEIAGRAAARAGFTLAGKTDARAILDARGNADLECLVASHAALARAGAAGLVDHLARAMAGVAGAFDGEEALLGTQPAAAVAGRALVRQGARLGARAMAGLAGDRARHAHRRFGAAVGLLERDLEVEAQVLAARVGAPARAARPAAATEHLVEYVAEYRSEVEALRAAEATGPARAHAALESGRAVAVIGRALVRILQDVVGVVDVLEFLLGVLVPRIAIRVVLHGELAECLFDVVCGSSTTDAQQLVIVLRHDSLRSPHLPLVPQQVGLPPHPEREAVVSCLLPAQLPEPVFLFLSVTSSNSASTTLSFLAPFAAPPASLPALPAPAAPALA